MPEASITIDGVEMLVDYDFTITAHGAPESGPTYSSGGEPAEGAEFDIEVTGLRFPAEGAGVPPLEMPRWLKELLTTALYERDDINEVVQQADRERGDGDPDYGRD